MGGLLYGPAAQAQTLMACNCLPHHLMACNCLPHQVARSTARTAEGIAKDAQSAASREVDGIKGKLQAVEKQRSALRAEVSSDDL